MHGDHPTSEELLQYLDASLPAAERTSVGTHLSECDSCARAAAEMERIGREVRRLPLEKTSPGFTASVLQEIGLGTSRRRQSRVLETAAAMAAMVMVAGLLLATFFVTGVLKENPDAGTQTAVDTILKSGGDALARGMSAVGTAVTPYCSFLFGKGVLGVSVAALAVLILLAIVDWIAGRRLIHRATK